MSASPAASGAPSVPPGVVPAGAPSVVGGVVPAGAPSVVGRSASAGRRPAGRDPAKPAKKVARVAPEPPSASLGAPNDGRLVGGARLDDSPSLRVYPARAGRDRRWALPELVGMLERSAARVALASPGSMLSVGDLSQRGGGDISLHHSHESGRDADVGFYAMTAAGRGFVGADFISFGPDGRSIDGRAIVFDDARNWSLVESWLSDPRAKVTHLFVADHLRARLLAHARRAGAPAALRARAAFAMQQPRHALSHDDHFHVRIACPPRTQPGCVEWPVARRPRHVARARRGHPATAVHPPGRRPAAPALAGAHGPPGSPGSLGSPGSPGSPGSRSTPARRPPADLRTPPTLHAAPAHEDWGAAEADVREEIELTDEGGELKIVD
ncbi:MAG: penicillin-insensitive murein endopeptidase [Polyangiaceae bacterium]|nr:penicillin-insensitive murein endopeptidase [Polyangiaceae bacterium]